MTIKDEIFNVLRTNYALRIVICTKVNTRVVNVERWAQRKSIPKWFVNEVVKIISEELNIDQDQIFEP